MIAIKDIPMPHDCRECPMQMYYMNCGQTWCRAASRMLATDYMEIRMEKRPPWCPLVEVEDMTENSKCPMVDNCHDEKHTFPAINMEQRRVLDEIGKKQETLLDVVKAWNNEIEKHGYVN